MKKLTIEQKAKLYDEAIERAEKWRNAPNVDKIPPFVDRIIDDIFPEFKESEDERIRKELIAFLKENLETGRADETWSMSGLERWIAWLEKQGEQKEYTFKSLPRLLDMIEPTSKAKAYCQKLIDALVKEGYTTDAKIVGECLKAMNGENVPMAIMDEKQGEQKQELLTKEKALKNYPFVEQKPVDLVAILKDYFANTPKEQQDKDWEELKHLNDIGPDIEIAFGAKDSELQEATYFIPKGFHAEIDGDKVAIKRIEQNPVRQQCADFYNKNSELQMPRLTAFENELANILFDREYDGSTETEDDIQRGKLDYELAAIRLAPKLQSLINIEQKPAWSEEDEKMLNSIIEDFGDGKTSNMLQEYFLKSLKSRVQPQPRQEWSKEDEENFARVDYACLKVYGGDSYSSDWLRKILGIHKKWKPSEEQMKVLDAAVMHSHLTTAEYDGLVKLREQLKKL